MLRRGHQVLATLKARLTHEQLDSVGIGPTVMTATVWWAVLAAIVLLTAGIFIAVAARKARAATTVARHAADAEEVHPVDQECARLGHAYGTYGTGWRCSRCGNHASRIEGELYGPPEDGRIDRRRVPR